MKDINYALMLLKANRFEGARVLLEELVQRDPASKDILYNLGMCLFFHEPIPLFLWPPR